MSAVPPLPGLPPRMMVRQGKPCPAMFDPQTAHPADEILGLVRGVHLYLEDPTYGTACCWCGGKPSERGQGWLVANPATHAVTVHASQPEAMAYANRAYKDQLSPFQRHLLRNNGTMRLLQRMGVLD